MFRKMAPHRGKMLATTLVCLLFCHTLCAQTYKVLHNFCGPDDPSDGWAVIAGLTLGSDGNLYGVTTLGGSPDCQVSVGNGTVFQLTPNSDGTWSENILHTFNIFDSGSPYSSLVFDNNRNLYGMTTLGGLGKGTIFQLVPGPGGTWTLNRLHMFTGGWDGGFGPNFSFGGLAFGGDGRLYGTTEGGGLHNSGVAFSFSQLSAVSWYELVLHSFGQTGGDGNDPRSEPRLGPDGSIYGTTFSGGSNNAGVVYRLTPNRRSFGWTETVIYSFQGSPYGSGSDGANPRARVTFDTVGNIYGTTIYGGPSGVGTVFKLSPNPDGTWSESVVYAFHGSPIDPDGGAPEGPVIVDHFGNLYGTTIGGGADEYGTVYKLTPSPEGQWTETILHSFTGWDGAWPTSGLVMDQAGNLYGTTEIGGTGGFEHGGVAFEITP